MALATWTRNGLATFEASTATKASLFHEAYDRQEAHPARVDAAAVPGRDAGSCGGSLRRSGQLDVGNGSLFWLRSNATFSLHMRTREFRHQRDRDATLQRNRNALRNVPPAFAWQCARTHLPRDHTQALSFLHFDWRPCHEGFEGSSRRASHGS